jgi:hypothetical protein
MSHSAICSGCGLPELHKKCVAHGTDVYMNTGHPAWGNKLAIEYLKVIKLLETPAIAKLREAARLVIANCYKDDNVLNRHQHTDVSCKAILDLQEALDGISQNVTPRPATP